MAGPTNITCESGIVVQANTHTVTIPTIGDFQIGFEDYEVSFSDAGGSVKLKLGKIVDEVKAKQYQFKVSLYSIPATTYLDLKNFAAADYSLFLETGEGSVTLELSGDTYTGCYIRDIQRPGTSLYDYEGNEVLNQIDLEIHHPKYSFY